jgi:hypothetical protein
MAEKMQNIKAKIVAALKISEKAY